MAIENRNLPVGTRLVADYKKTRLRLHGRSRRGGEDRRLRPGGRQALQEPERGRLRGHGRHGLQRLALLERRGRGDEARGAAPSRDGEEGSGKKASAPKARKPKATKLIYRMDDQTGATEGMTRWWCSACMDAFEVYGGEKPTQCPEGHRIDDAELTAPAGVTAEENQE